jgi:hypothetical protein
VVPERDDVRAGGEELVGELAGDPRAVRDVLAVHDARICGELVAQRRQALFDCAPTRSAEHVREKEESQLRIRDAAGRSSIET